MSVTGTIPYDAPLDAYAREAEALLGALKAGETSTMDTTEPEDRCAAPPSGPP